PPRWPKVLLTAALVVSALALAISIWINLHRESQGTAESPPKSAATSIPEKSIAVLPFENLSAQKENAYFTDGVQDEILTNLAKVAGLRVISRTSVMRYKSGVARNL